MSGSVPFLGSGAALAAPDALVIPARSGFVRLAFQREPLRVLWAVRADGVLCGLTYRLDQDVWAWHRHPRAGKVRDIAVIPAADGKTDEVWLVVERTIAGMVRRMVEVMACDPEGPAGTDPSDCVFLDSSLTYEGDPATTFSGLGHLEGEAVEVLADGLARGPYTVSGGQIVLEAPAAKVHVGLAFRALLEARPLPRPARDGVASARARAITDVRVDMRESIGGRAGRTDDATDPLLDRRVTDRFDAPPAPFTGTVSISVDQVWDTDGRIVILTDQPYPMTIEAITVASSQPGR